MQPYHFSKNFLRLFSAPIIWAAHFLLVYGLTGVFCARPALRQEWFGIGNLSWMISIATAAAIAAIVTIHAQDWRMRANNRAENMSFTRWAASGLALLSILAIAWETLPVFLVSACG